MILLQDVHHLNDPAGYFDGQMVAGTLFLAGHRRRPAAGKPPQCLTRWRCATYHIRKWNEIGPPSELSQNAPWSLLAVKAILMQTFGICSSNTLPSFVIKFDANLMLDIRLYNSGRVSGVEFFSNRALPLVTKMELGACFGLAIPAVCSQTYNTLLYLLYCICN